MEQIQSVFLSDLLPEPTQLLVDAKSVQLKIGNSHPQQLRDLSDGYRSMLALAIDMLRWLTVAFPLADDLLQSSGVVLIDELDAHAHPEWQQQIGHWLRQKFPNLQFIVATHSPFLAQVVDQPGGILKLERNSGGVTIESDVEPVEDMPAEDILIDLFGLQTTRSPKVRRKAQRMISLKSKKVDRALDPGESNELQELQQWSSTLPLVFDTPEEKRVARVVKDKLSEASDELRDVE
jgi:hypothetical protein